MALGVPAVATGVEVRMGAPTNVTPRGSGSWVGRGCSVESETSDKGWGREERVRTRQDQAPAWQGPLPALCGPFSCTFGGGSRPCAS